MASTLFKNVPSKVGDIINDVMTGRIGLPDLQRPFVWKDTKVRDLFDSMMRGYPIGYLMLWECPDTDKNRTICLNQELTAIHEEVLNNLESIHGALLRMNRSIQAEGTFGILKYDRWYKRVVRRGLDSVKLELLLVSIGHNLYKFFNKHFRLRSAA